MAISKAKKDTLVADLTALLSEAKLTAYARYQGLTVADLQELRKAAREAGVKIKVVKNRLVKVATPILPVSPASSFMRFLTPTKSLRPKFWLALPKLTLRSNSLVASTIQAKPWIKPKSPPWLQCHPKTSLLLRLWRSFSPQPRILFPRYRVAFPASFPVWKQKQISN